MCGIAGAIAPPDRLDEEALRQLGTRMGAAIAHRGPDDAGTWTDAAAGLVLAHRRLAIVDLSPEGHQPMMSDDGRWVIAFNGEIYNHHTLRGELAARGQAFRGHSDTEVLLAAIAHWGVEAALARSNGLLALAAGPERWAAFAACADSPFGMLVLFGFSWALAYHLINGVRHLVQDAGHGYAIPDFVRSSWISIIGSVVLVVVVWAIVLMRGGAA